VQLVRVHCSENRQAKVSLSLGNVKALTFLFLFTFDYFPGFSYCSFEDYQETVSKADFYFGGAKKNLDKLVLFF
jgi:hypothetical protein